MEQIEADDFDVDSLVADTMSAEFSAHLDGKPVTYPLTPFYDSDRDSLFVSSAPAFAGKVEKARENPEVSLMFDCTDDPVLVRGEATVHDDDLEHNARYVRRLYQSMPEGHKRRTFLKTERQLANPLGKLFLDWYGLRILVEIQPTEVERFNRSGTKEFPGWRAVDMPAAEAGKHERCVYTYVDENGPRSIPVSEFDVDDDHAELGLAGDAEVEDGQPSCLLLHWHADDMTRFGQRLVRGRSRCVDDDEILFDAGSSSEMSTEGALDFLRFVWDGKKRTREYFGESGVTGWTW